MNGFSMKFEPTVSGWPEFTKMFGLTEDIINTYSIDISAEITEVKACYDNNNLESMQFKLSNGSPIEFINDG